MPGKTEKKKSNRNKTKATATVAAHKADKPVRAAVAAAGQRVNRKKTHRAERIKANENNFSIYKKRLVKKPLFAFTTLKSQPACKQVTTDGFTITELRAFADNMQTKHNASIVAVTTLINRRGTRNGTFYTKPESILNLAKRYKKLVFGTYGGDSDEYRMVNEIPFQKPGAK